MCYTIIVPREMRITAEGTHQTRKRRASRGGDAMRQTSDELPTRFFKKSLKNPLTTNAECAIINTESEERKPH
jgi:hypothetical protein